MIYVSDSVRGRKLESPIDDLELAVLVQIQQISEQDLNGRSSRAMLGDIVLALRELSDLRKELANSLPNASGVRD